jgi:hypothetical protein
MKNMKSKKDRQDSLIRAMALAHRPRVGKLPDLSDNRFFRF